MSRTVKKVKRVLRIPFEWLGILLGLLAFVFLTRKGMLRLCDFIAWAMHGLDRRGKAMAHANLGIMYPERALSRRAEDLIVRRSYRNMARTVGYAFWTFSRARERARASGCLDARAREFLAANPVAVTVSGHIGCWEILSQLAFLEGHAMMSVAKDIGTGGMTKLLMRARKSIGEEIVPADGAFKPLMQGLRDGKSLGLLVDQAVRPSNGGIWVRFFGRPHPVSAAPAFFAAKGKAPVIVAWSRPLKDGRWRCEAVATYAPEEARDIWGMTQRCLRDLERIIRRHPSCWLLNYNCFRKHPTAEELAELEKREAGAK